MPRLKWIEAPIEEMMDVQSNAVFEGESFWDPVEIFDLPPGQDWRSKSSQVMINETIEDQCGFRVLALVRWLSILDACKCSIFDFIDISYEDLELIDFWVLDDGDKSSINDFKNLVNMLF